MQWRADKHYVLDATNTPIARVIDLKGRDTAATGTLLAAAPEMVDLLHRFVAMAREVAEYLPDGSNTEMADCYRDGHALLTRVGAL